MNDYILYINKGGEWMTVDLGNNKPAMNYQTNDIADLKSRQYDYSQALKIPMTKRNCWFFRKNMLEINSIVRVELKIY